MGLLYVGSVPTVSYMRSKYVGYVSQNPVEFTRDFSFQFYECAALRGSWVLWSIDRVSRALSLLSNSNSTPLSLLRVFHPAFMDKTNNQHWPGGPIFSTSSNTLFGAESYIATSWLSPTDSACLYSGLPDIAQEPFTTHTPNAKFQISVCVGSILRVIIWSCILYPAGNLIQYSVSCAVYPVSSILYPASCIRCILCILYTNQVLYGTLYPVLPTLYCILCPVIIFLHLVLYIETSMFIVSNVFCPPSRGITTVVFIQILTKASMCQMSKPYRIRAGASDSDNFMFSDFALWFLIVGKRSWQGCASWPYEELTTGLFLTCCLRFTIFPEIFVNFDRPWFIPF